MAVGQRKPSVESVVMIYIMREEGEVAILKKTTSFEKEVAEKVLAKALFNTP